MSAHEMQLIALASVFGWLAGYTIGKVLGRKEMKRRLAREYHNKLTIAVIKQTTKVWDESNRVWEDYMKEKGYE